MPARLLARQMLHRKRLTDPEAQSPGVARWVERLSRERSFWFTPPGANDDWCGRGRSGCRTRGACYLRSGPQPQGRGPRRGLQAAAAVLARAPAPARFWLYAAVRARGRGLLVSNDELRDHVFSLLRPRHFLKWRVRHIAQFRYATPVADAGESGGGGGALGFELRLPPAFTPCVQQLPESGAWMLPLTDGSWVALAPRHAPVAAEAGAVDGPKVRAGDATC
jgi:hypothetical protein